MKNLLTVCYYHVTYEFQSDSTLYSLPECQGTPCSKQAPYLKFKRQQRDLASLTRRLSVHLRNMWLWVRIPLLPEKLITVINTLDGSTLAINPIKNQKVDYLSSVLKNQVAKNDQEHLSARRYRIPSSVYSLFGLKRA